MDDKIMLNNGVIIPRIGYGTYKAAAGESAEVILKAIEAGYRYFDTASFYGTEPYLAEAIKQSGYDREEFFISSKVWKTEMGYEETKEAFQRSLERLNTDYLDLYLIHWPRPEDKTRHWETVDCETWHAMEELYQEGKVRAIGLSNFLPHHIENIMTVAKVYPAVNQIEFHPGYTQEETVNYCKQRNIVVQAWSPIGRGRVLAEPAIVSLAEKYGVSPARLCLRYAIQKNIIVLPKASSSERMKENQDVYSFCIDASDMKQIDELPQMGWSGEHPDKE